MEKPPGPGEMETQQIVKLPEADKKVIYDLQRSLILVAHVERHNLPLDPILLRTDDSEAAHAIRDKAVREWTATYAAGRPSLATLFELYYGAQNGVNKSKLQTVNPQSRESCSNFIKSLIDFGEDMHDRQQLA